MSVIVTGGAGFIGSHLCENLLIKGYDVVCLDNLYTGKMENIRHILPEKRFRFIRCDIRNLRQLKRIFKEEEAEKVFHFGAVVGVNRTLERPREVLKTNIEGTINVFEAALGCEKVIFASSSEVYGNSPDNPKREVGKKNAELPYAIGKLIGEEYAKVYNHEYGLKTTSLRYFNVYGPRQDSTPYGFVVAIFIRNILENRQLVIHGSGFQTRDFTYILDAVRPTIIASETKKADGKIINIGTGKPVRIIDLAKSIISMSGKSMEPKHIGGREYEIIDRVADIRMMKEVLNYEPEFDLETGLKMTLDSFKKSGGRANL